jgi:hypothetical protein
MRKIAIVGPQASKWTPEKEALAKVKILEILGNTNVLISGHCPLGGIDIWAEEMAKENNIETLIFKPQTNQWSDEIVEIGDEKVKGFEDIGYKAKIKLKGYKSRNIDIAEACDALYCIIPYRFGLFCTHHKDEQDQTDHPNNGGCWTRQYARKIGKQTYLEII